MENKKVTPITRINKWFSEEDFKLEIDLGREAIEGDGNFTLILYRIDRQLTEYDTLYGEASKEEGLPTPVAEGEASVPTEPATPELT
jgi:hypothetical protein